MKYTFLQKICAMIATLAGLGVEKYAPGTGATFVTLALVVWAWICSISVITQMIFVCCTIIAGYGFIAVALPLFNEDTDPTAIVLDEVVGTLVTFIAIKPSLTLLIGGFLLFRFFDIVKPLGIKRAEQLPHALGIITDDVVAGLYTCIILHLYSYFFI